MTDIIEPPTPSEVAKLLADVDQDRATELMQGLDAAAARNHATHADAMWAIAMLQARVLASAPMGDVQTWTARRFSELTRVALPAMMLAVERARRSASGEAPFDS